MALFHHKGTVHCLHNPTIKPSVPQLWPGGSGEAQCNYIKSDNWLPVFQKIQYPCRLLVASMWTRTHTI